MPKNRLRIRQFETTDNAPAASRASWIGTLQIEDFSVPVKAYSAIASPESHLHLIHAGCGRRVSMRKVCPVHGSLESADIRRAFAYSSDLLVELSEDELSALNPVDDKIIVIDRFFSPDRFELRLLAGRTLFLAPASLAAQQAFHLLKAAFDHKKTWALGRTVFSQKRQLVVIHSRDETLLLHTLHDPALRRMPVSIQPNGRASSRSDIRKLAALMVDRGGAIPWSDYHDDSHERLAALVASKIGTTSNGRNGKSKTPATTKPKRQRRARAAAKAA